MAGLFLSSLFENLGAGQAVGALPDRWSRVNRGLNNLVDGMLQLIIGSIQLQPSAMQPTNITCVVRQRLAE